MKKVLIFSILLLAGLVGSQLLPAWYGSEYRGMQLAISLLTTFCLGFIMIHVGYEFEIDRGNLRHYGWDYVVAATAAAFPWIFATVYFVCVFHPPSEWGHLRVWEEMGLTGRFAAPTSAGVLFSMLAAAGLSATWVFKKARVLAIFDDVDTILFMVPLQMLMVGMRWQLVIVVLILGVLLWIGWKWLHRVGWPVTWPWVMGYSAAIVIASELLYKLSQLVDVKAPIHIEVLLPAFIMGCVLARPQGASPHSDDVKEGHLEGPESPDEQLVATLVSGAFMLFVGLSMPVIGQSGGSGDGGMGWGRLLWHTVIITCLSNLGKMFPLLCYRKEATVRERLALCLGMWPRGEVGAGVLAVSIGYGIGGPAVTVAILSLALNLILTGLFIYGVKVLLKRP